MKKIIALLLFTVCFFCACSAPSSIARGSWDGYIYYNSYGDFVICSNELFDRYSDKKIRENLGYVYSKDGGVLNDVVISSDYCAVVVTLEKPTETYTQKEYADAFVLNTQKNNKPGTYSIAERYNQTIAGKTYTAIPLTYYTSSSAGLVGYFEYTYIYKTNEGVFVVIRITATDPVNIEIALKMFQEPIEDADKE
ncbi:MAG: MEMO1 family protein [Clostridia bacterium]|nr:MEMO1 family protein [Clostridia bacterium]